MTTEEKIKKIHNYIIDSTKYDSLKTENIYDEYLGSGIRIKRQVKKYGKENFEKEILFIYDNKDDAFEKEKELLNIHLNESLCLNIATGGEGGSLFAGKKHSNAAKLKNKINALGRKHIHNDVQSKLVKPDELQKYLNDGWKIGRHKKDCNYGRKAWNKGLKTGKQTEEHRLKISKALKK